MRNVQRPMKRPERPYCDSNSDIDIIVKTILKAIDNKKEDGISVENPSF